MISIVMDSVCNIRPTNYSTASLVDTITPYLHKLLTINNYVNCPSNFAFARSIYLFHPPILEKILMRIRSIGAVESVLGNGMSLEVHVL